MVEARQRRKRDIPAGDRSIHGPLRPRGPLQVRDKQFQKSQ